MAKMHPFYEEDEINQRITADGKVAERWLYRKLRDMPGTEKWDVLYNTSLNSGGDAQCDFLVFCPEKGVVNVDAKGPGYSYRDNQWYLGDAPLRKSIEQELDNGIMRFVAHAEKATMRKDWGGYGKLAVFYEIPEGHLPREYHYVMREDVEAGKLKEHILNELDTPAARRVNDKFTNDVYKQLLIPFIKDYKFRPYLVDFSKNDETLKNFLTYEQLKIKTAIDSKQYVHITGGAGTGKTLLARGCAEKFASEGKKVLYLCYNESLATYIEQCVNSRPDIKNNIRISHYDVIPTKILGKKISVVKFPNSEETDWDETRKKISEMIFDAELPEERRFDVLLFDESQDVSPELFYTLPALGRESLTMAFFSDSAQGLFYNGWNFPKEDFPGIEEYPLSVNMRNTIQIHKNFVQYVNDNVSQPNTIKGPPPEKFNSSVVAKIQELIDAGRHPYDIAVLAYQKSTLEGIKNAGGICFTERFSQWNNENVLKTTVQSFKGLEANIVIIADADDMPQLPEKKLKILHYVAESRAKYRLYFHQRQ